MKYRKKPVVIEAFQVTEEYLRSFRDETRFAPSCKGRCVEYVNREKHPKIIGCIHYKKEEDHLLISTLEGQMRANVGDWIITGVKGEVYPCKPDIFKATYDKLKEPKC